MEAYFDQIRADCEKMLIDHFENSYISKKNCYFTPQV